MKEIVVERSSPVLREDWAIGWYSSVNEAWENVYYGLNVDGDERSPRGLKVKETLGCNIYISNPADNLVYNMFRGMSPTYVFKEYLWYKSGSNKVEDAAKLSKFWETIANPDGTVNSNYGHYIFVPESDGRTVWEKTVDILRNDPDTRQAIIQIPIMPARGSKDTPCTSHVHFHIRDNKLLMTVAMRSTDIVLGAANDWTQFTMWQIEMAKELGIGFGWFRFVSDNIHVYEKNWIENVQDKRGFYFDKAYIIDDNGNTTLYNGSDKTTDSFKNDINILATNSPKEAINLVNDPMLRFMLANYKIWK